MVLTIFVTIQMKKYIADLSNVSSFSENIGAAMHDADDFISEDDDDNFDYDEH